MAAFADDLVTDRPDTTESSSVMAPGSVQIEAGWLYTENDDSDTEINEIPQTLVRIGVIDGVELRLGWAGYIDEGSGGASGVGDGKIGTKVYLFEADGNIPETALLVAISIPVGDDEFTSAEVDPSFRFTMAQYLSEDVSVGVNLGVEWVTDADDWFIGAGA